MKGVVVGIFVKGSNSVRDFLFKLILHQPLTELCTIFLENSWVVTGESSLSATVEGWLMLSLIHI